MKALLLTNEYPPNVYGGAGVHVEFLSRGLAEFMEVEVRSFGDQRVIHAELAGLYGEEEAERLSAPPGHSEHQLGTTVDFTSREARYTVGPAFEGTSAHGWLRDHAHEYGFVQSYERGKEEETGYRAEAWHYRFIGEENARRLQGTDLSLRACLLREGETPRCG